MGIPGSYLTVTVNGAVIAETTDVNLKIEAKAVESTSKDSGVNSEYIGGLIKVAIAGKFLLSEGGANWDTLWSSFNGGTEVEVAFYRDSVSFFSGYGIIRKLTIEGGNSDTLVTGMYGIRYNFTQQGATSEGILSEDGFTLRAETGETLLIE